MNLSKETSYRGYAELEAFDYSLKTIFFVPFFCQRQSEYYIFIKTLLRKPFLQ